MEEDRKLDLILEKISTIETDVGSLKTDVGSLKTDVGSLKEGQQRNYDLIQKNGIKIEQVASDVRAVAEGHSVIRSEMRQMEERLIDKISENTASIKFVAARG